MKMNRAKAVGLFFASPFIGLAYVIALPWVFLYMVANNSVEVGLNKASEFVEGKIKETV